MTAGWRTLWTVSVLTGLYQAYVAVVSPLTTSVVTETTLAAIVRGEDRLPSLADDAARQYLPDQSWAADAQTQLNLGKEGFAFFNKQQPIKDDRENRIRFTPFAMIWFNPRREDGRPYTVTCESLVVEFKHKFDPGRRDAEKNRIVGGEFEGEVRITGPDGLELVGRNVVMSEEQDYANLYSEHPVSFAYGPSTGRHAKVRGRAVAFEITLITDDDSILGEDMPRIGGMERIVLRRDVEIDIVLEDEGRLTPISIRSDGRFEYDVGNLVAEFNDNVDVSSPTHLPGRPEAFDRLACEQLSLAFEPKPPEEAGLAHSESDPNPVIQPVAGTSMSSGDRSRGIDLDLQLRVLRAIGREVVLSSDKNQVHGRMGDLQYDVSSRTLQMIHDEQFENVQIQFGSSFLACPEIRVIHDEEEESRIQSAWCLGAGKAWRTDLETGEKEVEVSWSEGLKMSKDPGSEWDVLELHGDARIVQSQQQTGIRGDLLQVWFDSDELQETGEQNWQTGRTGTGTERTGTGQKLPLHRVVAEQTGGTPVALVSPKLVLETGRLELSFAETTGTHPLDPSRGDSNPFRPRADDGERDLPLYVEAGEVNASILVDLASEESDVSVLKASTDVRVTGSLSVAQSSESENADEEPFFIECETLTLEQEGGGHILRLQGAPARIQRSGEFKIEGNDIRLNRAQNDARVVGPGTIHWHVDRDLEGRELETGDQILTVRWQELMHFDGQSASFLGETKTVLADSVMHCHRMDVTLNRRISFMDDDPPAADLDLANIHCREGVTLEYHKFSEPSSDERQVVVCFRKMKMADFSFDRSTGNFHALGPGHIQDWQRGDGRQRVRIGPQSVSRANQVVESDKREWSYTRLDFAGELSGNQIERFLKLRDRVEVMHGPVERALQEIERNDFSDEPESMEHSVWLGSDQMNLQLRSARSPEERDWLEVVAFGNAEMEGKVFMARADSISYDESKEQFTLKGKGGNKAGIWYQKVPGQQSRPVFANTIQFIPSKNRVRVDGSTGGRFSP